VEEQRPRSSLPARQRHLMTPGGQRSRRPDPMSLGTVQKWVLSTLAVSTAAHLAGGLVLLSVFMEPPRRGAQLGLLVIAGLIGVLSIAGARAIHQVSIVTPWLLVGFLPTLVGGYFALWR